MKIDIKIEGIEELQKEIERRQRIPLAVPGVVMANGIRLEKQAKQNAEFKGHWIRTAEGPKFVKPSGTLKRSIGLEMRDNGFTAAVSPATEYAAYVELGTRHMDAQPYLRPALEQVKPQFIADLKKVMKMK